MAVGAFPNSYVPCKPPYDTDIFHGIRLSIVTSWCYGLMEMKDSSASPMPILQARFSRYYNELVQDIP
jgi:hypothetical protein